MRLRLHEHYIEPDARTSFIAEPTLVVPQLQARGMFSSRDAKHGGCSPAEMPGCAPIMLRRSNIRVASAHTLLGHREPGRR